MIWAALQLANTPAKRDVREPVLFLHQIPPQWLADEPGGAQPAGLAAGVRALQLSSGSPPAQLAKTNHSDQP